MRATILNCTLKKSPAHSNTHLLAEEVTLGLREWGVECETIRLVDMNTLRASPPMRGRRRVARRVGEDNRLPT